MAASESPLPDVNTRLQQGLVLQQQGRFAEAGELYEQVLAIQADHFDALHLLGVIAAQTGNPARAVALMGKAIELRSDLAPVYFNRGVALQQLQRLEEAVASFDQAIAIQPNHAYAFFQRGLALQALHRTSEALASFEHIIAIKPDFTQAHFNRGNALTELKRTEEALASFERAIAIQPDYANAYFNCGIALEVLKRPEEAVASYQRAIAIQPNDADAHCNLGNALHQLKRYDEALASFERAIALKPGDAEIHFHHGISLKMLNRTADAAGSFSRAIAINPDFHKPYWDKSLALLQLGHFEEGWQLYEWRWKLKDKVDPQQLNLARPLWLGEPGLSGKIILLHAEQGLGDTIQFCRYAELVKAQGATVLLEVPKALMGLLSQLEGVDRVIEKGSPLPDFDYHCPIMSLPLAFKTRLDTIPSSVQYLFAEPEKSTLWQHKLGVKRRPRVGLVWSSGFRPNQPETWAVNQLKNVPLAQLEILEGLDVDFISLQKGEPAESELAAALGSGWAGPAIADYGADLQDFSDTAALIENLDLVISVCTSVAHLAAALGKPVWVLNHFHKCWRWLQDRSDSPWYPTVKLYNQARAGDWEEVMQRVKQDLASITGDSHPQDVSALMQQGQALQQQGQFAAAHTLYQQVLAREPNNFDAHFNAGLALQDLRRNEEAIASYDRAIAIKPDHAAALANRGIALHGLGRSEEALQSFDLATAFNPGYAAGYCNRGTALHKLERYEEALTSYERAISIDPNDAEFYYKRAISLVALNRLEDALASYDKAIAINPHNPDSHWNKSLLLLNLGRMEEGWSLYQWRFKRKTHMNLGAHYHLVQPPWLGHESLAGKTILLHAEQGFGDTIQFCRYAKLVKALGATVLLEVPRALMGLLSRLEGVDRLIERGAEAPAFNYHCPLMSLPMAFKTRLDTIPSSVRYLFAEPEKSKVWKHKLGVKSRPRVGLVWSGGFRPHQPEVWAVNERRNMPFELLGKLKGLELDFISLQKGEPAASELAAAVRSGWAGPAITDYSADLQDFSDTAALIENLDLVISVDTSVAHLAAALGKPVWILNRFDNCWRWLLDRTDSPWYPTVRLYNQRSAGDWEEVLQRVKQDLSSLTGDSHPLEVSTLMQQCQTLHLQGRLAQAEALYEQVLAIQADHFDALHMLGVIAVQTGNPARAVEFMDKAIEARPDQAPVYFNRGIALQQLQRLDEAVASFDQAIAIQPDHAKAYFRRGLALQALQRTEEAIASFGCAIAIQPNYADAYFNRGNALLELQRSEEALASYDRAIIINPDFVEAYSNRGNALLNLKRHEEAIASYTDAIVIKPDNLGACFNRGIALQQLDRTEEALASFERAIAIQPDHADAHFHCGIVLENLQRTEEAVDSYGRAIASRPLDDNAYCNRGVLLHKLKRTEEAIASFDRAISINPDHVEAHFNRGTSLSTVMRTEEAVSSYSSAIALRPDDASAYWNKSMALLQLGHFEQGWQLYEWRWRRTVKPKVGTYNLTHPLWLGEPSLSGKTILLYAEQGLGDTIQFCRYAKLVKAQGATVLLEVPKPLLALLTGLEGVDSVIEQGSPLPDFDYHCPLMSLPLAFKTRLDTIPSSARYLFPETEKSKLWQHKLGVKSRPRVGLVWSGGFRPHQPEVWAVNERRNMPFELLGKLKGLEVDFISLQKGEPAASELAAAMRAGWAGPAIADYSADLQDFSDTAALIENLDLVISVDTSVAHLAAALGKPVWILNRFDNCWRWLQDRSDSPWYPTVKLYNQVRAGDWEEVLQRVRQDLTGFAEPRCFPLV